MSDSTQALAVQSTPQRAPRIFVPVDDVIPILDTARFEHMQRIATAMAASNLIPESLRCEKQGEGNNAVTVPLPLAVVTANCFLIVNQATRWNMDPFAVAQCTSVVRGKLMYEGKLVHAVLEARLGISLAYSFGKWNQARLEVEEGVEASDETLGVIVRGTLPGESSARDVHGSVGLWRTAGNNSPWSNPGNWRRQLRYRGAREWSRAHEPGVMLGVITDDEIDELVERRELLRAAAPQQAPRLTHDFPAEPQGASQTGASSDAPQDTGAASEGHSASAGSDGAAVSEQTLPPHDKVTGEVLEEGQGPTETAGAQSAAAEPDSSDSATPASGASPAPTGSGPTESSAKSDDGQAEDEEEETTAPSGEVYYLFSEGLGEDGKRPTFKDGEPFSRATEKGASKLKGYDHHAPKLAAPPPAETQEQKPAAPTDASAFAEAHEKLQAATGWLGAKQVLKTLSATEAWKACDDEGKRMMRLAAWERFVELRDSGQDTTQVTADFLLFRLWLEFAASSAAEIDGLWAGFFRNPAYRDAKKDDQNGINQLMIDRKKELPAA